MNIPVSNVNMSLILSIFNSLICLFFLCVCDKFIAYSLQFLNNGLISMIPYSYAISKVTNNQRMINITQVYFV